jgi:hypothetical protein
MSIVTGRSAATSPLGPRGRRLPAARSLRYNPSDEELAELTSRMPNARRTAYGNYNVQTRVVSRSAGSTYLVTDDPDQTTGRTISEPTRKIASINSVSKIF